MSQESAGVLMFRRKIGLLQVLLVHPGGPFWRRKDLGAWTIPKGERLPEEDAEAAARREFAEETGHALGGPLLPLGRIKQRGGKQVDAFAVEGDFDPGRLTCNAFEIEWPPRSGRRQAFPEVDKAEWFALDEARLKINVAQVELIDRLEALVAHLP
jgi:predicted NUDIX family NTP pyrophosphohydrolase